MSHPITRRLLTAAAFAVAGSLALAGCQSGGGADGTTTLSFFSWDNEKAMAPVIDAFEAAHPDITIEFSTAPPVEEYISTLQTRLLSNTAADVFILAAENKSSVIDGGYALDLSGESFMDPIADFNKETYSSDKGTFGMSVASWGGGIVVNQDLLDSVGATEFPTDWEGFLTLCADLKKAGITPFYDNLQEIPMTVNALIGDEYQGDTTVDARIFAGDTTFEKEWTPALKNFNKLFEQGLVSKDVVGLTGDQIVDEFAGGRVAMLATGPWNVGRIRESAPDLKFVFQPFPSPNSNTVLPGAASPGYAINAKTQHLEAAKEFLSFLSSEEGVSLYNESTAAITTTANFDPTLDDSLTAIVSEVRKGNIYLAQISWPSNQDSLSSEAVARLQEMVLGQQTPEAVASSLDRKLAEVK